MEQLNKENGELTIRLQTATRDLEAHQRAKLKQKTVELWKKPLRTEVNFPVSVFVIRKTDHRVCVTYGLSETSPRSRGARSSQ